ncbi:MAG: 4-hydroxy-tetrahydrodipicolinate synthase [Epsilonproteobacteria bacterium]|nr:4-hydroxy-tetrahydrodipicolinate synthase [Campylobacterota bacterium]MBD3839440.1 4-hydroxy-tetrahydrodipicolinate synthase [Campylobacterota bacterium]
MTYPISGATTALITPFKNGKIDEATYAKLIKRQIDNGIDAVCPVGTTGESATLSYDEDKRCIEIAVEVCKGTKTKVLAGAGSNSTNEAIEMAKFAQECGVDAIFSVTPYYNKPSQEGIYQHYKAIASSIEVPFMLYNVPSRTGVDVSVDTMERLFKDCANIFGVKEASGSLNKVVALQSQIPNFAIFSGDDAIDFPILASGGVGITSVTSNLLPDLKAKMVHLAFDGALNEAKKLNEELYAINKILFCESNPIPIKAAMYIAGLIDTLEYKLPLIAPSSENLRAIERVMKNYNIVGA